MFLLVIHLVINRDINIDFLVVIILLCFIINGQLRIFYFSHNKVFIIISLLLDLIILSYCYSIYLGISFLCYLPICLDVVYLLKKPINYIMYTLFVIVFILSSWVHDFLVDMHLISGIALTIIVVLFEYIRIQNEDIIEAQKLYQQLRISEDKLKRANIELEEYTSSIEKLAILKERNRISRDIHDSVGHGLSTIIIQLGAIEKIAKQKGNNEIQRMAEYLREFAKKSLEEVRNAVKQLKPIDYENYESILTIKELIKTFEKLSGIKVRLTVSKETWKLSSEKMTVLYRAIQEFLSNAGRHGKASVVNIFINYTEKQIVVVLKDNGLGAKDIEMGVGLTGIKERVKELGGTVEYNTSPNEGFLLKLAISKGGIIDE